MNTRSNNSHDGSDGHVHYKTHGGHCVCEICTCNKHRCPPGMMHYPPDALKSTFKNDYPAYEINSSPQQRKNYQYQPTNYAPDLMKTTNQQDYTPKKASQPHRHQREEPVANNIPFNAESEYKTNYLKNQIPSQARSTHKPQQAFNSVPFQGQSTYAENYKGSPVQARQPARNQQYVASTIPFEGASTYTQEYKQYEVPRNQNHRKEPHQLSKVPFEGHTSYQDEYKRYQGAYGKDPCPIYSLPKVPRNCSPGKNHIHYRDEIQQWE